MSDFAIREVSPTSSIPIVKRLAGQTVLIPRGGDFAQDITTRLTVLGARAVVAPVINFASADDSTALDEAFTDLQNGNYDWLVLTSATAVDVLHHLRICIPDNTKVAAIGETTEQALTFAGFRVDFVPGNDNSARGFLANLPEGFGAAKVLVPHAETSEPVLEAGLAALDTDARFVSAYRTVGVALPADVIAGVRGGEITSILVSSGSVARYLAEQLQPIPDSTAIVCIGPRTAFDASSVGLAVSATAAERTNEALIDALLDYLDA
jgi:uroporphyrinogen-III synthase